MSTPATPESSKSKRVTFRKVEADVFAMATYEVLLDGAVIGNVSKIRDRYLRRLGGHRGNNVHAARDAWTVGRFGSKYDTRDEATIALVAETDDIGYAAALDIVKPKA